METHANPTVIATKIGMALSTLSLVLGCGGDNSTASIGGTSTTSVGGASGGAGARQCVSANCDSSTTWLSVSAGSGAACAIRADNTVACWGASMYGAPGAFTDLNSVSVGLGEEEYFYGNEITSFDGYQTIRSACGVKTDGTLHCWWDGDMFPPSGTFSLVSTGSNFACGLKTDGTLACWGDDQYNQNAHWQTSPPTGTFSSVSCGHESACGVMTDSTLVCWGGPMNSSTSTATSTNTSTSLSTGTTIAGTFSSVSVGYAFACATRTDGSLLCWGENSDGQTTQPSGSFLSVSAGSGSACALNTDHAVVCWGRQLSSSLVSPTAPPEGTYSSVSVGDTFACGVMTDGTLACWGDLPGMPPKS